jgi:HK97 family phage prohead protease
VSRRAKSIGQADAQATESTQSGRVLTFYASTFSATPDAVGDVVDPGAFDAWLALFKGSGRRLPIVVSHQWNEVPDSVIGYAEADDITVDSKGLLIRAHLYETPKANRIWELAADGVLTDASFAYDTLSEARDRRGVNHLQMFSDIFEAGPCLVGANRDAAIVSAKFSLSDELRAVIEITKLDAFLDASKLRELEEAERRRIRAEIDALAP